MSQELKGCPFCGGRAEFKIEYHDDAGYYPFTQPSVCCTVCDAAMHHDECGSSWNTRHTSPDMVSVPRDKLKDFTTKFFYDWYNSPGTNTQDGYDTWFESTGKSMLSASEEQSE